MAAEKAGPKRSRGKGSRSKEDATAFVPSSPVPRLTGYVRLLTDSLERALVEKLERGTFIEQACAELGLPRATFYKWMKRGRRVFADQPNPEFNERCEVFAANIEAAQARALGTAQRVLFAASLGTLLPGEDPECSLDPRVAESYLRTRDAQSIAIERSQLAKLQRAKMREEIRQLEAGGRTNEQVRRDAEERATQSILTALQGILDESQFNALLHRLSGTVGGEDAAPREADSGRRDAGRDRESEAPSESPGESAPTSG